MGATYCRGECGADSGDVGYQCLGHTGIMTRGGSTPQHGMVTGGGMRPGGILASLLLSLLVTWGEAGGGNMTGLVEALDRLGERMVDR